MKPKLLAVFLAAAALPLGLVRAQAETIENQIESVFAELRTLKSMQSGRSYTLSANGTAVTGRNDDFLRRRTADEIEASGLSCGCGDYAILFIERIRPRGFETLLVDSAQLSSGSLANTFSGHAVVALRPTDNPTAPWWLVDSTARKILSHDWSVDAKSFVASGHVYWIGYCGPVERYPVHTPDELKRFYASTLATVPHDVLNRTLYRFNFAIDASLKDANGDDLNPRVSRLRSEQDRIFAKYGIEPKQAVAVLLTRGGDDASGDVSLRDNQWVARVGLKSACSPSFLSYLEGRIRSAGLNQ